MHFSLTTILVLISAVASLAGEYKVTPDNVSIQRMMVLPSRLPKNWHPKTFLDIPYEWPSSYITRFGQPFNPYTFLQNSKTVELLNKSENRTLIKRMAAYLAFVAGQYIEQTDGCRYVTNDFDYEFFRGLTFKKGFRGSFMNNVTAFGFINLYEATGDTNYLDTAHDLLRSTAFCKNDNVKLRAHDENGFLWLNEYVFLLAHGEKDLAKKIGFQDDGNGWYRAHIYNGHIISLVPFIKYEEITGSREFDDIIQEAIRTMDHYLPMQAYKGKYFSYMSDFRIWPDYGQPRAVILAEGLCTMTSDENLCNTAKRMRSLFAEKIEGHVEDVLESGYKAAKGSLE